MRNGLDFDPVAEFPRFGIDLVDAEGSIDHRVENSARRLTQTLNACSLGQGHTPARPLK
jgi:hypothetical protein